MVVVGRGDCIHAEKTTLPFLGHDIRIGYDDL